MSAGQPANRGGGTELKPLLGERVWTVVRQPVNGGLPVVLPPLPFDPHEFRRLCVLFLPLLLSLDWLGLETLSAAPSTEATAAVAMRRARSGSCPWAMRA